MWQVVVAIAITGLLLAIVGVTSDVLTYRELQRKLRQGEGKDLPLREPFKRLLYKFQTGKQARNNANSPVSRKFFKHSAQNTIFWAVPSLFLS